MSLEEVAKLIALNKSNYPQAYREISSLELKAMVKSWHLSLEPYPAELILRAYQRALESCRFPVSLADIFSVLKSQRRAEQESPEQLWQQALRAARRAKEKSYYLQFTNNSSSKKYPGKSQAYEARQEILDTLASLPPPVKAWFGGGTRLVEIGGMEPEKLEQIIWPSFRRYILQEQEKEEMLQPLLLSQPGQAELLEQEAL